MSEVAQYALEAGIYIVGALVLISAVIVIKDWGRRRGERKDEEELIKYIKPMMYYMKVKGVDDFVFDCKRWQRQQGITIEARAMLKERYKALSDLGANGERDSAWKAIKDLPIIAGEEKG